MDVDQPLARKAAPLVKAIDVLGDEQLDATGVRQIGEGAVAGIRLGPRG